jgi:outer membrane protein assembly factor BamE
MRFISYMLILQTLAISACVYRPDIKQGNYMTPGMIEQIKPGMTETQVRFIMGPPMVRDPFHADRWDYVYYDLPSSLSKDKSIVKEHVVVYFKDGKVLSVQQLIPVHKQSG